MFRLNASSTREKLMAAAVAAGLAAGFASAASAQVVVNETSYDDAGTDDREFVEIYNAGGAPVDISGWTLTGRDATTVNSSAVVPAATMLAPGAFYVFGNLGVLNTNQVVAGGFLENDIESVEIRDAGGAMVDALIYETNKGIIGNLTGSDLPGQTGPGWFGNNGTTPDTADNTRMSLGRLVDGRDTNNNGRDFGMRGSTPGTSNNTGTMTFYPTPNPVNLSLGSDVPGLTGSFVHAKVIDPTVAGGNNTNAIPDGRSRAIAAWDPAGGGNSTTSNAVFNTTQSGFNIRAFLDTSDLPQNFNASNVNFTGSEVTIYGIGGGDMLCNLTDLGGNIGLSPVALPGSESANGTTGIAWVYERTAISGASPATQMLYLVDANDGGDSDVGGNTPLDWTILQAIDISNLTSEWFELGINIDGSGNGVATFNGQTYNFAAGALNSGAFNVMYRENTQIGADGTPDALMRPPTFTGFFPVYWDVNAATPGAGGATPTGNWNGSTANFNTDATGGGAGVLAGLTTVADDVVFAAASDGTGTYTVTVSGTQSANSVNIARGNVTLTGGSIIAGVYDVAAGATGTVASTVIGNVDHTGVVKSGAGTLTFTANNTYTGGTTVRAGTLEVNRMHENNPVNIIGGTLRVVESAPGIGTGTPSGNNASVSRPLSLSVAAGATLDLTNNDLILDYTDALDNPAVAIEALIKLGYNNGDWFGTGITSSIAQQDPAYALAVADNALLTTPFASFDGQTVDDTTLLVKFTWVDDLDLDGLVTANDAIQFGNNYSPGDPATHMTGDMDYDGVFTANDAIIFGNNYDTSLPSLPEPASMSVLALLGIGLRRRTRHRM